MHKNKIKVIIVDDEYLIRELLEKKVDWEKLNCEIMLKASCASEVYDYIDEYSVDLIITDISMPVIDGLDMARKIRIEYPKVKIIVLTGYDDFEYAQKGIDIGIQGYILKPINQSDMEEAVRKVIDQIEEELNQEIEYERLNKRIKDDQPFLKEKIFFDMILKRIPPARLVEKAKIYNIDVASSCHQIGIIEIQFLENSLHVEEKEFLSVYEAKMLLENYFKEKIENLKNLYVFSDSNNTLYLYNTDQSINLYEELKYCIRILNEQLEYDIRLGISTVKTSFKEIAIAYQEAKAAVQYGLVCGCNQLCRYDEIGLMQEREAEDELNMQDELTKLEFFIKAGLIKEVNGCIESMFNEFSVVVQLNIYKENSFLQVQLARIISALQYFVLSLDFTVQEQLKENHQFLKLSDFSRLYNIKTIPDGKKVITEYCSILVEHINRLQQNNDETIIDSINTYIEENLGNYELTLRGTAEKFFINPSYLSRIYKKQTGKSFKERVIMLRMEKAVLLLKSTELKVYEVANEVGLVDPNYFSLCFKKYMCMSISDYRKKITKESK